MKCPFARAVFFLMLMAAFQSCVSPPMSLDDARKMRIQIAGQSVAPPPRGIQDVTAVLSQNFPDPKAVAELEAVADSPPPATTSKTAWIRYYYKRGVAAEKLGRQAQYLDDMRAAARWIGDATGKTPLTMNVMTRLAVAEVFHNNYRAGIATIDRAKALMPTWTGTNEILVHLYADMGDIPKAEYARAAMQDQLAEWGTGYEAGTWRRHKNAKTLAVILTAKGMHAEAEPHIRIAIETAQRSVIKNNYSQNYHHARRMLVDNLIAQNRYVAAEIEVRRAIEESQTAYGHTAPQTMITASRLAELLFKQGRYTDAVKLQERIIELLAAAGYPESSPMMAWRKYQMGRFLMEAGRGQAALRFFSDAMAGIGNTEYLTDPYFPLALLANGRIEQAERRLSRAITYIDSDLDGAHTNRAVLIGMRASAYGMRGDTPAAVATFQSAVADIVDDAGNNTAPVVFVMERYLEVLAEIMGSDLERQYGIDAVSEGFRVAEFIGARSVQDALAKRFARAAVGNPDYRRLVREEQDARHQIVHLESLLIDHLRASPDQREDALIADLKNRIAALKSARTVIAENISRRFSQYDDLLRRRPIDVAGVQQLLADGEVFLLVYPAVRSTYTWAIPANGPAAMAVADLPRRRVQEIVDALREALDPSPQTFADIPVFDTVLAHTLYRKLLAPLATVWGPADQFLIVASGPLGRLPFSLLPTAKVTVGTGGKVLFAEYRKVPWLMDVHPVTRLPTATSLRYLRAKEPRDIALKAFVGFGDPVFNLHAAADKAPAMAAETLASRGGRLQVRGIRVSEKGSLDAAVIDTVGIQSLQRLPGTADEIREIAAALNADPQTDVFLGTDASEAQVKRLDLSNRRVVGFATHALVPGDLDGLDQPAIALSPSSADDGEDGLLTMEEVLSLNLNADWVVLSGCNTGAADGQGAEALSGLGKAFFYAGARSLLVSMWPVETRSARQLTTAVFRCHQQAPTASKAVVLRRAMGELIRQGGIRDEETETLRVSYAHPLFWAPFEIVGDSR